MSFDSFVRAPFSRKQLLSIRDCTASVNIWDGSIRACKTLVSLVAWMIFIADAPPTGEVVMIGRYVRVALHATRLGPADSFAARVPRNCPPDRVSDERGGCPTCARRPPDAC